MLNFHLEEALRKDTITAMKKQEKLREEEKYTELEMLYRGIR